MENFPIWAAISLLGIAYPPQGKHSYNIPCPCCDTGNKKHLNVHLKRDVFRCPRCGASGGTIDMYVLHAGCSRKAAYDALAAYCGKGEGACPPPVTRPEVIPVRARPEETDTVYRRLLERLSLADDHRDGLLRRGMTHDAITSAGYKTTPAIGHARLAERILSEGFYTAGVPGFYRKDDGKPMLVRTGRGIMIPVKDCRGLICGLQIRLDDSERKFRWLSSAGLKDGTGPEACVHFAGSPSAEDFLITEGPMKADIIRMFTGLTVLSVPGVHALGKLEEALMHMRLAGAGHARIAFDMDSLTNLHVKEALHKMGKLLTDMGFTRSVCLWNPHYKGLDDFLASDEGSII